MKLKNIIIIAVLILVSSSCDEYEVFEKEQYKNVFSLISEDQENVYSKTIDFRQAEADGYIAFSIGGTNPTDKDITVNVVEDASLINAYNLSKYDMGVDRYIHPLPADKYDITSSKCIIPAGTTGAQILMKIRPEGLSPDSAYFIAVRVDSYSGFEINPLKDYLLYKVMVKNQWCAGDNGDRGRSTAYTDTGSEKVAGSTDMPAQLSGTKIMRPISANQVRILPGKVIHNYDRVLFEKAAIVLTINEDNSVDFEGYKHMQVEKMNDDPDYPNTFVVENDGYASFQTFALRYNYTLDGVTYEVREELRRSFNEEQEAIKE